MNRIIAVLIALLPLIPAGVFLLRRHKQGPAAATRHFILGLSTVNLVVAFLVLGLGLVWFFAPSLVAAAGLAQEAAGTDAYASLAAGIAVGLGSVGAAYAVGTTGSAAVGAVAEKPEVFGRALIFVGLAEGIAIYGLIIAFIILNR
ncbi:MAG: ATP synthase subunit C [Anaerolineae bacterium]|jgi:V/A-type H+-transporting ATPase subunit K|nr:ATP synthase subunit C [Anaerolineae bacterium]